MVSDPNANEPDLTLPEKPVDRANQPSMSAEFRADPHREEIRAATNPGPMPELKIEPVPESSVIAWFALAYAMFASLCVLIPDRPHVGNPAQPAYELFMKGMFLVPGFWMAMGRFRKGGPTTVAWLALLLLTAQFLFVVALLLWFLRKPW
jgi:hypothetical protein